MGKPSPSETDQTLEDHNEFEELFRTYYPFVVRQVMRILPSPSIAEDIAQEVFVQFYHTDRTVIENIPAWLAKATIHATYNHLRSEKRHLARVKKESLYLLDSFPSTESEWLSREDVVMVRRALLQMDDRERTLLLMKYAGFSYEELAQVMQIKKGYVGTLLSRAKNRFRKLFQQVRGDGG